MGGMCPSSHFEKVFALTLFEEKIRICSFEAENL